MAGSKGQYSKHTVSPPPSYATSDAGGGSSFASAPAPPPPYIPSPAAEARHGETTPLLIHQRPIVVVHGSPNVVIRIARETRHKPLFALLILATISFLFGIFRGFFLPPYPPTLPAPPPIYNVAIVGAGPAGIAAAQYLQHSPLEKDVRFNITIFESSPIIGGMLAIHDPNGQPVFPNDDPMQSPIAAEDIAGTALMWQNALFTHDSEKLLRDKLVFTELGTEQVGYYDNETNIVSSARPYSKVPLAKWAKLFWAYGASLYRAAKFNQEGNLREAILKAPVTTDTKQIFSSLGVLEHLQKSAETLLLERGISEKYATAILEPQVQRAFNHGLRHATGLAAILSAALEDSANAWKGGHMIERLEQITRRLCARVRTSTRVVALELDDWRGGQPIQWSVHYENGGETSTEKFDRVLLTALDPSIGIRSSDDGMQNLSPLYKYEMNDQMDGSEEGYFIPVYITFFTSNAKLSAWGDHDQVLFLNGTGGTQEVAFVRETTSRAETQYLYRVLSQTSVLEELRSQYDILWDYETMIPNWQAKRLPLLYPPNLDKTFGESGLWCSSLIQEAWSTVDLNWLAGKSVADALIKQVLEGN
ncbi:hypothetical protein F5Y03DRAFT_365997 [Xylaria venustula]|nr:hypothetical protein F5Y03DRAFT_365997 [Xylaria venustula]